MFVWFTVIAVLGVKQIIIRPEILYALNPFYAVVLIKNKTTVSTCC
jgi:KUP system potassium uptake protein